MSKHYRKQNDCLNCGATVHGKFCGNCGQENIDLHESFWHFISHSIGHYFHFDTKFFNTIVPLITKPGQLTLDYIEGKRTRYLQPISMFIFISIAYFLITSFLHPKEKVKELDNKIVNINTIQTLSEYKKGLSILPEQLKDISLKQINKAQIEYFRSLTKERQNQITDSLNKIASKQKNSSEIKELINDLKNKGGLIESKNQSRKTQIENSDLYTNKEILKKYGPKVFFVLTPIFAFFLMKNFRKDKKYYVEHVIFTVHFHSFTFITLLVNSLINFLSLNLISDLLGIVIFGIFVWYIYKSLKIVYQRSEGVTIRKMFTLGILYSISFGISLGLIQLIVKNIPNY